MIRKTIELSALIAGWDKRNAAPPKTERRPARARRTFATILLCLAWPLLGGCGSSGLESLIVEGVVTFCGENVETGQIRFVPIGDTPGSTNVSAILNGRYRIEARGGVPLGRYRVEIAAEKRTGRKVMGNTGFEPGMIDETVRLGPPDYAGSKSPLTAEITEQSDGRLNFDLPRQ